MIINLLRNPSGTFQHILALSSTFWHFSILKFRTQILHRFHHQLLQYYLLHPQQGLLSAKCSAITLFHPYKIRLRFLLDWAMVDPHIIAILLRYWARSLTSCTILFSYYYYIKGIQIAWFFYDFILKYNLNLLFYSLIFSW